MRVFLSLVLVFICFSSACAQKFLVIDRYGTKRERLVEGDKIKFKQKLNPAVFNDYIVLLKDTSLVISTSQLEIPLSEFETFYFQRSVPTYLQYSGLFIAAGFLFSSAIHPLISDAQYSQRESFVIGTSFLVGSQSMRLFKWKKYRMGKRGRVRILDTTFR